MHHDHVPSEVAEYSLPPEVREAVVQRLWTRHRVAGVYGWQLLRELERLLLLKAEARDTQAGVYSPSGARHSPPVVHSWCEAVGYQAAGHLATHTHADCACTHVVSCALPLSTARSSQRAFGAVQAGLTKPGTS
jgi:hypothetical protein